jgi:hypothetical protein
LAARVNFFNTESFLFKTEITVLTRFLYSTLSLRDPLMDSVCEKAAVLKKMQTIHEKNNLMAYEMV